MGNNRYDLNSHRKELEERMIELRSDIKSYRKHGADHPQYLDDAIDEFTEIETQLEENDNE